MGTHASLQLLRIAQIYSLEYIFGTFTSFVKSAALFDGTHLLSNKTTLQQQSLSFISMMNRKFGPSAERGFMTASSAFNIRLIVKFRAFQNREAFEFRFVIGTRQILILSHLVYNHSLWVLLPLYLSRLSTCWSSCSIRNILFNSIFSIIISIIILFLDLLMACLIETCISLKPSFGGTCNPKMLIFACVVTSGHPWFLNFSPALSLLRASVCLQSSSRPVLLVYHIKVLINHDQRVLFRIEVHSLEVFLGCYDYLLAF